MAGDNHEEAERRIKMALKVLLLRNKLDAKNKELVKLREKSTEFDKREKELETAVSEMTEDTPEEDRKVVEGDVEKFNGEKEEHDNTVKNLQEEITKLEGDIADAEKTEPVAPVQPETPAERSGGNQKMAAVRTKFYGMTVQERDAFFENEKVKTFLNEVRTCMKEKRALTNAGLVIPEVMLELLKQKVQDTSKLLSRVATRPVKGTARQRIMGDIPEAIWTEMCAKLNEMSLGFNDIEVDGYKVGGYFAIHNAIIEDNDVNLTSEIVNALGKAIGKAIDKAIIYGTGTKMPLGIVTRLAQTTAPSDYPATARTWEDLHTSHILTGTGATGINLFKEIVKHVGVTENDYSETGLAFVMNKKTHMDLMVESMDKNLNAAIVGGIGTQMPVVGGDIIELPFVPDGDVISGYFDAYLLAEREGTVIGQSEHVRFLDDQTVFKGIARYDGTPVIAEAFEIFSIGTTAPATTVAFPTDTANA